MKIVMVRAWEIATNAAERFGGKKSEYFSEALKSAWRFHKIRHAEKKMVVTGNKDTRRFKIERCFNKEVVEVCEDMDFQDYANTYKHFVKRGFNNVEFYEIENGVKSFRGTKVVA